GHVAHALTGRQRERQGAVDQWFAELRLRGVVVVEVDRCRVLGKQREPDVVRRRDRSAERVLIDLAYREVLEKPPAPTLLDRHFMPILIWLETQVGLPDSRVVANLRRGSAQRHPSV